MHRQKFSHDGGEYTGVEVVVNLEDWMEGASIGGQELYLALSRQFSLFYIPTQSMWSIRNLNLEMLSYT